LIDILTKPWSCDLHLFVENQLKSPAEAALLPRQKRTRRKSSSG
jgi:hypothetical protein